MVVLFVLPEYDVQFTKTHTHTHKKKTFYVAYSYCRSLSGILFTEWDWSVLETQLFSLQDSYHPYISPKDKLRGPVLY